MATRQRDSARHYLDMTAVSATLDTTLRVAAQSLGFDRAALYVLDDDNRHLLASVGFPSPLESVVRRSSRRHTSPTERRVRAPVRGREGLDIGFLELTVDGPPHAGPARLDDIVALLGDQLEVQRDRLRTGAAPIAHLSAAIFQTEPFAAAGRIVPYYQPIVDLATGDVCAYEALARWVHPTHGVIDPAQFVPVAEQSEIIIDLDLAILARASVDMAQWRGRSERLRLNANLSAQHLRHADCVDYIVDTVVAGGLSPSHVTLEITEATALGLDNRSIRFVERLHEAGFSIWLDDLGTGWSSLERLIRLPVDGLKVDRSICSTVDTVLGEAVVRAVGTIAGSAGIASTVEGIETEAGFENARSAGIAFGQGYFWDRPKPASDVEIVASATAAIARTSSVAELDLATGIVAELTGFNVERARRLLAELATTAGLDTVEYARKLIGDPSEREFVRALLPEAD